MPLDPRASTEIGKVDHERASDDFAADRRDQLERGLRRASGRDQVVDEQHAFATRDRVAVHLEAVGPVLELVVLADVLGRELARLADRDEADAKLARERRADDEAARLDPRDLVDAPAAIRSGETLEDLEWKGARREELLALCREIGDDDFPSRVPRFRQ